jgi:hypothetical protein
MARVLRHYRTAHEPDPDEIFAFGPATNTNLSLYQKRQFVRNRDRRLWLEFESSHLLIELIDALAAEFPQARFVFTIRNCFTWLESAINSSLNINVPHYWRHYAALRYAWPGFSHSSHAQVLADHGLPPLDTFLMRWVTFNRLVLDTTPPERLLIIRTHEIIQSGARLADFLNIPEGTLDMSQAHVYRAPKTYNLVAQIDPAFLLDKVAEYCDALMREFYPEVTSPQDAQQLERRNA